MTIDQILFGIFGVLLGIAGDRVLDYMRGRDTVLSLQRDNKKLENENRQLRQKLAHCLKSESDRVSKENDQKDHHRNQQQVDVLRMLGTQDGKSVKQIANQLGIGPELALKHLVDLSYDQFAESPNYSDDPNWDDGCEPHDSVWYIKQPGRTYLANNGLLT